jgi:hypothetical protein
VLSLGELSRRRVNDDYDDDDDDDDVVVAAETAGGGLFSQSSNNVLQNGLYSCEGKGGQFHLPLAKTMHQDQKPMMDDFFSFSKIFGEGFTGSYSPSIIQQKNVCVGIE